MRRIGLTPRERQVAHALATTADKHEELAKFLGMSVSNVKKRSGVICDKLKMRSRIELACYWRYEIFHIGLDSL